MIFDKYNPYEARFISEHEMSINFLADIAKDVSNTIKTLYSACSDTSDKDNGQPLYTDFITEKFSPLVDASMLRFLISLNSYTKIAHFINQISWRVDSVRPIINIYGNPKFGDNGHDVNVLKQDMQGPYGESEFTLEDNIGVFVYDRTHMFDHRDNYYNGSENNIFAIDVSEKLVRFISLRKEFDISDEVLIDSIKKIIITKLFAYSNNMRTMIHMIYNKFINQKEIYNDFNLYRLFELTLARWAYAVANNLTSDDTYGVDLDTLIDSVKSHMVMTVPTTNVMNVVNLGLDKLHGNEYLMRRSIDRYITYLKDEFNMKQNHINPYTVKNPYAHNRALKTHRRIVIKTDNRESDNYNWEEKLIAAYESYQEPEDNRAFKMIGIESNLKPTDPKFAEFRRKERQDILQKLTSIERKRYMDIENDFIKLKAEVINASTQEAQRVLLKRCAMLGDVINLELDRTNNEYMATILYALDSDRFALQSDLSDRNIFKERNTRLYGQLKTTNKWDY